MSKRPFREIPGFMAVSKKAGKAIVDFGMIKEGDRIAVAVSGGKDSLSLLHVLRHRQRVSPVPFTFTAVHIDFQFPDFDPSALIKYFQEQEFPYLLEQNDYLQGERYDQIDCFWWSRNRRRSLLECGDREGFTKIAFGHHLDDIAETILLNQFYRGEIGAMKPKLSLFGGKVVIIRPLAYVREQQMVELAKELKITSIGQSKCANDDTSHRMKIKQMLREFEKTSPMIVSNIFKSLQNVREEYLLEKPHEQERNDSRVLVSRP